MDSEISDGESLAAFLMDIECLKPLEQRANRFNLFEVLGCARTEIRHSNVLAWLLNPNENHGFGEKILRGVIEFWNNSSEEKITVRDFGSFVVMREWEHIDILAVSDEERIAVCIENKIGTSEHDDQLSRYQKTMQAKYEGYKVCYVYLSPEGEESSDPENWMAMDYHEIYDIISVAMREVRLADDVDLLVKNYLTIIKEKVMKDDEIAKICNQIYAKHKRALDLIYENIPDGASHLTSIFVKWTEKKEQEGAIRLCRERSYNRYTRFTDDFMTSRFPDNPEKFSAWKTHNFYFYEIANIPGGKFFQIAFFTGRMSRLTEKQKVIVEKLAAEFKPNVDLLKNSYLVMFRERINLPEEDATEEQVFRELDRCYEILLKFEEKVKEILG